MKKIAVHAALTFLAIFLAGCSAQVPFDRASPVATRPLPLETLLENHWLLDTGVYRIRQTGVFRIGWKKIPLEGFAQVDTGQKTVRLVGLSGMGMKLFDLLVSRQTVTVHYMMPQLEEHPRFAEAVAESVRRIFLAPQPDRGDVLSRDRYRYMIRRRESGGEYRFHFGGREALLLEKEGRGGEEDWRVRYFEFRRLENLWVPGGIVLEDEAAGYRLTLWLDEIKRMAS